MIGSRLFGGGSVLVAYLLFSAAALAAPPAIGLSRLVAKEAIPIVVFGKNGRKTIAEFALAHHENAAQLRRNYAASGIVRCGLAHGAGQLTLANNVITTAAHVFFDESGKPRASSCRFEVMRGDATVSVSINMQSIVAGSRDPYAVAAVHDWASAQLDMPILDATPYQIAPPQSPGARIKFIARGHIDWGHARRLSIEDCRLHDQLNRSAEGTREFSFDCETGDGASGGAAMTRAGVGELIAVLVGYRSINPDAPLPFSSLHYNFGVTVEGAFRTAVETLAKPSTSNVVAASGARPPN